MIFADAARLEASARLLHEVCRIAHPTHEFTLSGSLFATQQLKRALRKGDNAVVYDWLMTVFSYQGIADKAAETIIARDGNATWAKIDDSLRGKHTCPKLRGFWRFESCGFSKSHQRCNSSQHYAECPLPRLPLRNGALNQLAYSLYFFFRDVADGDFLTWLGSRIRMASEGGYANLENALITPLRVVHGISDKVISMALSDLMLASPNPVWRRLGAEFVVVDRLIHNFMHRSGILRRHDCEHPYGLAC